MSRKKKADAAFIIWQMTEKIDRFVKKNDKQSVNKTFNYTKKI